MVSPARLADRPQQPPAEAVVGRAADCDQAGGDQLLLAERLLLEVLEQGLAVAGCEADAELLRGRAVEASLGEERARDLGVGGEQLAGVELLREAVGFDQPGPGRSAWPVLGGLAVVLLAPQLDAVLVGEALHRVGEREPVVLHHERDDVAAFLAAEAVKKPTARGDVERRGLLVVEGAETLQRATTGVAQGDVGPDDVVDLRLLAHLCDVVLADASCHVAESTGRGGPGRRRWGRKVAPTGVVSPRRMLGQRDDHEREDR